MASENTSKTPPSARDRILLAARKLFYENGIRATGTNRLIQEAGVTKVTFYRHFPSKNDLVIAFLHDRHTRWIAWFEDALIRHGGNLDALVPALAEWFEQADFRGCGFINTVGEQGQTLPQTREITQQHKQAMTQVIENLLTPTEQQSDLAQSLALAVDGAIVWAQFSDPQSALASLARLVTILVTSGAASDQGLSSLHTTPS